MKHRIRQESEQLVDDYADVFYKILGNGTRIDEAHRRAVSSPAPHWYICKLRARRILLRMQRGMRIVFNDTSIRKCEALYALVLPLMEELSLSFDEALTEALNRPAPEFFISVNTGRLLIRKHRKSKFKAR